MSSGTMKFNGYLRVRIGEAVGLQPTRWSLRHSLFKKGHQLLDPYLTVSVDQVRVGQTSTKQKTNKPTYNEEFCANVTDGGHLELAVFHETPLGYDHFVANCTLQFQELLRTAGASDTFEGWICAFALNSEEQIELRVRKFVKITEVGRVENRNPIKKRQSLSLFELIGLSKNDGDERMQLKAPVSSKMKNKTNHSSMYFVVSYDVSRSEDTLVNSLASGSWRTSNKALLSDVCGILSHVQDRHPSPDRIDSEKSKKQLGHGSEDLR
ncbi:hypothetical protein STEG23_023070, partial [Scotinomys teguina]